MAEYNYYYQSVFYYIRYFDALISRTSLPLDFVDPLNSDDMGRNKKNKNKNGHNRNNYENNGYNRNNYENNGHNRNNYENNQNRNHPYPPISAHRPNNGNFELGQGNHQAGNFQSNDSSNGFWQSQGGFSNDYNKGNTMQQFQGIDEKNSSHKKPVLSIVALNSVQTLHELYRDGKIFASTDNPYIGKLYGSIYRPSKVLNEKISLYKGDITALKVDAIVNAANDKLITGGGIDLAIHKAAGFELKDACAKLNGCPIGEAKLTKGFKLPANYVIHAVGPQQETPSQLQSCYLNSLNIAIDNKIKSIALPCISTGVYGYPNVDAAMVAIETVRIFLESNYKSFDRIIFVTFLDKDNDIYKKVLPLYFPPI